MTDPTTTPDTAETIAHLRAVISHLNITIAHLETLIAKAWCLQPGDRVLVMRDTCLSPFGHPPLCSKVVTLKRPCTGRTGDSGVHWYVEEYPHAAMPEAPAPREVLTCAAGHSGLTSLPTMWLLE